MKILLLLLYSFFIINAATAQNSPAKSLKTKQVTYSKYFFTEKYNVLQADKLVKHGSYKATVKGVWQVEGQYDQNKPVGVWSYYGKNRQLDKQYDFGSNTYLKKSKNSGSYKYVAKTSETTPAATILDEEPFFITGDGGVSSIISLNIKYPRDAINAGISGAVLITAEITETGEMVNEKVARGLFDSMDKEAIRVVQLIPDEWVPGRANGKPVRTQVTIPVNYTLK